MAFLNVLVGFDLKIQTIALDALLPSKKVPDGAMTSRKFHQIKASIREVGLIEPLSVSRPDAFKNEFLLLDGHKLELDSHTRSFFVKVGADETAMVRRVKQEIPIHPRCTLAVERERAADPALCVSSG